MTKRRSNATTAPWIAGLAIALCLSLLPATAVEAGTSSAIAYQGELRHSGVPANGVYDFQFEVHAAEVGLMPVAPPEVVVGVEVVDGIFQVRLDFGDIFDGSEYWLELSVRENAGGGFTLLAPRQRLERVPYSHQAREADNAQMLQGLGPAALNQSTHVADNANPHQLSAVQIGAASQADLAAHSGSASAHHARYGDSEAVNAILAVDGSGSGLDADRLDGAEASDFVAVAGDSMTGNLTVAGSVAAQELNATVQGVRFPDNSLQTSAAIDPPVNLNCPAGTHVVAFDPDANAICGGGRPPTVRDLAGEQVFGGYTDITIHQGLPYITWMTGPSFGDKTVHLVRCQTTSCSVLKAHDLGTVDWLAGNIAVAVNDDGIPLVAVYETTDLTIIRCRNPACTGSPVREVIRNYGSITADAWLDITIGADGNPVISDSHDSALFVVRCGDPLCDPLNVTSTQIATTGDSGRFNRIATGPDGLPAVVFVNATDAEVKFLHCGNIDCTSGNSLETAFTNALLDRTNLVYSGGLPVLGAIANDNLILRLCSDLDCSLGPFRILRFNDPMMGELALGIGADGLPTVSIFDATTRTRGFTRCQNSNCDTPPAQVQFAPIFDVSGSAEMTVGGDGLPVLAIEGKLIHCGRFDCASF